MSDDTDMSDRDTLAALILPHLGHTPGTIGGQWADAQAGEIADAILAAGWFKSPVHIALWDNYTCSHVSGVYATKEAAEAAHPDADEISTHDVDH